MPGFESDYELHKAGLKDLPYEPLEEPVRFVTKCHFLRIPIVPSDTRVINGKSFVINGIRADFINGFFETRDPRVVGYLRSELNARGRNCQFQEMPSHDELSKATYINERMKVEVDQLRMRLEAQYDSDKKEKKMGEMKVVPHASEAHLQKAKEAFDMSVFYAEQKSKVEAAKAMAETPIPAPKPKKKASPPPPEPEPDSLGGDVDLGDLLGEGDTS